MPPLESLSVFDLRHPAYDVLTVMVFVLGACIGSFLNVVIRRIPAGESLSREPSHCPRCNFQLKWYHNIPVLSWLALRGRCANCRAPISARYPAVELLTAVLFTLVWLRAAVDATGPGPIGPWQVLAYLVLTGILIADSFIDIDTFEIPLPITLFGLAVALLLVLFVPAAFGLPATPVAPEVLLHSSPITGTFAMLVHNLAWPGILDAPRVQAGLHLLLGIVFGGGFLWVLAKVGQVIFGRKVRKTEAPIVMKLRAEGFETEEPDGEPDHETWDFLFAYDSDRMRIHGDVLSVDVTDPAGSAASPEPAPAGSPGSGEVVVGPRGVLLPGREEPIPLANLREIRVRTQRWVEPQLAMGDGDVHLMAVIGAFLGPGACLMILCLAAFSGAIFGGGMLLLSAGRLGTAIPFGPHIALAAMLYMLLAERLLALYLAFSAWLHG